MLALERIKEEKQGRNTILPYEKVAVEFHLAELARLTVASAKEGVNQEVPPEHLAMLAEVMAVAALEIKELRKALDEAQS